MRLICPKICTRSLRYKLYSKSFWRLKKNLFHFESEGWKNKKKQQDLILRQEGRILSYLWEGQSLYTMNWMKLICFTQSTDWMVISLDTIKDIPGKNIWAPSGPIKLSHKINHHIIKSSQEEEMPYYILKLHGRLTHNTQIRVGSVWLIKVILGLVNCF